VAASHTTITGADCWRAYAEIANPFFNSQVASHTPWRVQVDLHGTRRHHFDVKLEPISTMRISNRLDVEGSGSKFRYIIADANIILPT